MYNFVSIDGILEKNSSFHRNSTPVFYNSAIMNGSIWPAIYISHIQLFTAHRLRQQPIAYNKKTEDLASPLLFSLIRSPPRRIRSRPSPERPPRKQDNTIIQNTPGTRPRKSSLPAA